MSMSLRSISLCCRRLSKASPGGSTTLSSAGASTLTSTTELLSFSRRSAILQIRIRLGRFSSTANQQKPPQTQHIEKVNAPAEVAEGAAAELDGGVLEGATGRTLGKVVRHGRGDACITLDVGGKEFRTLRSTVNSNPVLADHVARAEANKEFTKAGAVFIDRDPTHFGFILTYLRNKVEMLTYSKNSTISLSKFTSNYARLPNDPNSLSDLYIEASYYRIEELQEVLTRTGWFIKLVDFLGAGNPFDAATKWISRIRNFMVMSTAFGTLGGTIILTMQYDFDLFLKAVGLRSEEKEEESSGGIWQALRLAKKNPEKKEPEKPPSIAEAIQQITKS